MGKKVRINSEIEGRGRNGWIMIKDASIWHLLGMGTKRTGQVQVEFRSKRIGDAAPLIIRGNENDILTLFEAITEKIREGIKKPQNPAA